ncbi:hypothetical protein KP509_08G031600 [Ceratopteris richardii]|uniref:Uncharacterized protein n=1 Tax=Ceratopteris richardii TaxID=49495 RepID=A0A8T2UCY5_CERRI|nr:hypothetical protein KP509_08G031600 [Ceratopteris richardii]
MCTQGDSIQCLRRPMHNPAMSMQTYLTNFHEACVHTSMLIVSQGESPILTSASQDAAATHLQSMCASGTPHETKGANHSDGFVCHFVQQCTVVSLNNSVSFTFEACANDGPLTKAVENTPANLCAPGALSLHASVAP